MSKNWKNPKQKYRKTVKNIEKFSKTAKKPDENLQKYRKIVKNVGKCQKN